MGKRKSMFAGGKRSLSAKSAKSEGKPTKPTIDNSIEALEERQASRKVLPVYDLRGDIPTIDQRRPTKYKYDLTNLVEKYPHHQRLITQLLAGMLRIVVGLGAKNIDTYNKSILEFIEFLNDPRNLSNTKVYSVSDINVTICQAYKTYLINQYPRRTVNQSRFGMLRRIVHNLQNDFSHDPEIGSLLQWPVGLSGNTKPRQGYSSESIGELVAACQRDIKETIELHRICNAAKEGEVIRITEWNLANLMVYLIVRIAKCRQRTIGDFIGRIADSSPNARKFLEKNGYSVKAIIALYESRGEELADRGQYPGKKWADWTLENFMFRIRYKWTHNSETLKTIKETIKYLLRRSSSAKEFLEANNYSSDDIVKIYMTQGEELASTGRNPFGHKFHGKGSDEDGEISFKLVLATLCQKYPDYPFNMSLEAATWFLGYDRYINLEAKELPTIEGRLLSAMNRIGTPHYQGKIKGVNLIRAAKHFLVETLYPFLLHVQINSGWNMESILALTDDVDSHVTPDLLYPDNYVVIQSTKVRGQKKEAKPIFHRCSRDQQFSSYRLLKYVESIVTQYKDCSSYRSGHLWQYAVRSSSQMKQLISYYGESNSDKFFASKWFLERHSFKHFKDVSVDHGRIRTSYATLRELQGVPFEMISHDLDHEDDETTSTHYDSDTTSDAAKDVKVAEYQEQLVDELRHYQCRVVESESLAQLREALETSHEDAKQKSRLAESARSLGMSEKTLVHLISPEGQTYIAACRDSSNPTWIGHEEYLKKGQRCSFFNKCGGCKQAVIFREALPWIARRLMDLDLLRAETNQFEWLSSYGEEWDQWNGVLSDWSDQSAVEAAREAAKRGDVVLPLRMRGAR